MDQEEMTFQDAVEILGITDLENLNEENLDRLRKKARKRWHPDRVSYMNSEETINRYKLKFQSIDDAIDCISAYLSGEIHQHDSHSRSYDASPQEEPEEIQRRNAPNMQNVLRQVWETIKKQGYKRTNEKIMVYEGCSLKDALNSDIEDKIPEFCMTAFFSGIFLILISFIFTFIVGAFFVSGASPQFKDFLSRTADIIFVIIFYLHIFSCFIVALPISRFWLPSSIFSFVSIFVNISHNFFVICAPYIRIGSPLGIFIIILTVLINVFTFLILRPIYFIIGEIIGEYTVGKLYRKGVFYAGLADWYIEELLNTDVSKMDSTALRHLGELYGEMKEMFENKGF